MADELQHLGGREHLGLLVKAGLVLGVVDFHIPGGHNEDGLLPHQEGEGLGDAGGLGAQGLGGQFHGGAGLWQLPHPGLHAELLEIGLYLLDGHRKEPLFTN